MREKPSLTRRELIAGSSALGAVGALVTACDIPPPAENLSPLSDAALANASALSGESLTTERIQAQKAVLEFNLKHLEVMREFDAGEEEPLTMFSL